MSEVSGKVLQCFVVDCSTIDVFMFMCVSWLAQEPVATSKVQSAKTTEVSVWSGRWNTGKELHCWGTSLLAQVVALACCKVLTQLAVINVFKIVFTEYLRLRILRHSRKVVSHRRHSQTSEHCNVTCKEQMLKFYFCKIMTEFGAEIV
jgi:hypothetical protein